MLSRLADIAEDFGARYRRVLAETRPRSRRLIACSSPADFVRQIEPSAQGARRIAATVETAVRGERSGAAVSLFASRKAGDAPLGR